MEVYLLWVEQPKCSAGLRQGNEWQNCEMALSRNFLLSSSPWKKLPWFLDHGYILAESHFHGFHMNPVSILSIEATAPSLKKSLEAVVRAILCGIINGSKPSDTYSKPALSILTLIQQSTASSYHVSATC